MNEYDIKATNEDKVLTMLAVDDSWMEEKELVEWFRQKLAKK